MAGSPRHSLGNVRSDMDITYPEHLSRLHRHSVLAEYPKPHFNPKKNKNTRNRRGNRYRTQPVTFDEIQEVDEENMVMDNQISDDQVYSKSASLSTSKLELDFYRFTKAFEAKCKKSATTPGAESKPGHLDFGVKDNGLPSVHNTSPVDQSRWTDYGREGSV